MAYPRRSQGVGSVTGQTLRLPSELPLTSTVPLRFQRSLTMPPLCPLSTSAVDFGHGAELVDRARRASLKWIDDGDIDLPAPERFLAAHRHRSSAPATHG